MTLDEAIEHAKEVADTCKNKQCANDHRQLQNWLEEYKELQDRMLEISREITGVNKTGFEEGSSIVESSLKPSKRYKDFIDWLVFMDKLDKLNIKTM